MLTQKVKRFLDLVGPFTSGLGTFLGTYVLSICYPYYKGSLLDEYLGYFGFILPVLLAYFLCTCTCGRKKFILFSWGSVGGVAGFFVGILFMLPFQIMFWSWVVGFATSTTIFTIIFSFLFHRVFHKKNVKICGKP